MSKGSKKKEKKQKEASAKRYLIKENLAELAKCLPPLGSVMETSSDPTVCLHLVYPPKELHWWIMEGGLYKGTIVFSSYVNDVNGCIEFTRQTLAEVCSDCCNDSAKIEIDTKWKAKKISAVKNIPAAQIDFACLPVFTDDEGRECFGLVRIK